MFVIERKNLLVALSTIEPHAPSRAARVAISAEEDGNVRVLVGNDETGASCSTMGRVLLPGIVGVPLKPFVSALQSSRGHKVEFAANAKQVVAAIDGESSSSRRYVFPVEETEPPECPTVEPGAVAVTISAEGFRRCVDQVAFAASRRPTEGEWATGCIEITAEDSRLTLAATDLYRLAVANTPAELPRSKSAQSLIHEGTLRTWARIAKKEDAVRFTFGTRVVFSVGGLTAWASPCEGLFPDWRNETRAEAKYTVGLAAGSFRDAVKGVLSMLNPDDPTITVATRRGGLVVSANAGEGKAEIVVPIPGFMGPAAVLPLDGQRLLAILLA